MREKSIILFRYPVHFCGYVCTSDRITEGIVCVSYIDRASGRECRLSGDDVAQARPRITMYGQDAYDGYKPNYRTRTSTSHTLIFFFFQIFAARVSAAAAGIRGRVNFVQR